MKLTETQEGLLKLLGQSPLAEKFYWTGGTLLAYRYLQHRRSVDLDFFTQKRFSFDEVNQFAQEAKDALRFAGVHAKKVFDRREFFLERPDETLRIEFVYYNGHRKTLHARTETVFGVAIDSLEDISANKALAYFDWTEPKDLFDIYFLLTKTDCTVRKLLSRVQEKFGVVFTETLFWSEGFKHLPLLPSLRPLIEGKSEAESKQLLAAIEDYFKEGSAAFLRESFSSF